MPCTATLSDRSNSDPNSWFVGGVYAADNALDASSSTWAFATIFSAKNFSLTKACKTRTVV